MTATWAYDPDTGDLQTKTFADGSTDNYEYNDKGELASVTEPGLTETLHYDASGRQSDAQYFDSQTGLVESQVRSRDDQGNPLVTVDTDNGQTYATTDAYTSLGDLKRETFASAGNTAVNYAYYPTSGFGSTGAPDALDSMTVNLPNGQSPVSKT